MSSRFFRFFYSSLPTLIITLALLTESAQPNTSFAQQSDISSYTLYPETSKEHNLKSTGTLSQNQTPQLTGFYKKIMALLEQETEGIWPLNTLITTMYQNKDTILWSQEFTSDEWITTGACLLATRKEYILSALLYAAPPEFINLRDSQGNSLLHYAVRECVIRATSSPYAVPADFTALLNFLMDKEHFEHIVTANNRQETPLHIAVLNKAYPVIIAFSHSLKNRIHKFLLADNMSYFDKLGIVSEAGTFFPFLHYYYLLDDKEMIKALLETELFNINAISYCANYTPVLLEQSADRIDNHECLDPEHCNKTLFSYAAQNQDLDFSSYLLGHRDISSSGITDQELDLYAQTVNDAESTISQSTAGTDSLNLEDLEDAFFDNLDLEDEQNENNPLSFVDIKITYEPHYHITIGGDVNISL